MEWNPGTYLKFGGERTRPAMDLLARIPVERPARVADLGCGPGNSTALLAARWPRARIDGIDSSREMLAKAQASGVGANWIEADIASWSPDAPYDVIFSNAALHWAPGHADLLPRLMAHVAPGGALAFQVPRNFAAPSYALMREVANDGPWAAKLAGARKRHVESPEIYYDILAPLSTALDIWETEYLHALKGDDPVLAWAGGTGLCPFAQCLEGAEREAFVSEYRARLREAYPRRGDGATLFPFKRLFVVAQR